jgi:NADPH:quinone reductase-like Zn-dependent oxidoreductase
MKALVYQSPEEGVTLQDLPDPRAGEGQLVVRLRAAALNHRDVWITKGQYPGIRPGVILGSDGAGEVDGQAVIINPNVNWGDDERMHGPDYSILGMPTHGTFAEYLAVGADRVAPMPAHLSWAEAAALPLAGLTAYRALFTRGALRSGERVLITGIGGGVALMALQFARLTGVEVHVTSSSEEKIEKAIALGARSGANYRKESWSKELKKEAGYFDLIVDSAGGPGFNDLLRLAAPGGRIVTYGGTAGAIPGFRTQQVFWKQLSIMGVKMGSDQDFADMVAFVAQHEMKPVVDSVWPLEHATGALAHMEAGQQFGKIVLEI